MTQLAQRATPGADFVSLITQYQALPTASLQSLTSDAGPQGAAATFVMKNRMAKMGLDNMVTPGAMAIPSSFPNSNVLRQIQGTPADRALPPLSEGAEPPMEIGAIPRNSLVFGQDRPTVVGAMPPPSRDTAPPPPPTPITPSPIIDPATMGLPSAAAAAATKDVADTPKLDPDAEEERRDKFMALAQAGLATLASNSRSGLGAIGEGGLVGLQALQGSRKERRTAKREKELMARQELRDQQQMDMQLQRMALEKELQGQKMALSREEMDITRSRYDPANPLNAAQIQRDKAAAAASYASAARAKQEGVSGGGSGASLGSKPLFGNSAPGLAYDRLVRSGKMSVEEAATRLASRPVTGQNGEYGTLMPDGTLVPIREGALGTDERKQVLEADKSSEKAQGAAKALDRALELNPQAFAGPGAEWKAFADRLIPGDRGGTATTEYQNIINRQVLDTLDTFTNPTEGEREFSKKLQADTNYTAKEREILLKEGQELMRQRQAREAARAEGIRSGTYYQPGGAGPRVSNAPPAPDLKSLSNEEFLRMLEGK